VDGGVVAGGVVAGGVVAGVLAGAVVGSWPEVIVGVGLLVAVAALGAAADAVAAEAEMFPEIACCKPLTSCARLASAASSSGVLALAVSFEASACESRFESHCGLPPLALLL